MDKFRRRLTKVGRARTMSSSSGDKPNRRHRSISATFSSAAAIPSHDLDHTPQQPKIHLCYLGYVTMDEPRNTRDISAVVRNVMATANDSKNVAVTYDSGVLAVSEENGDRLILCPFQHLAIIMQDTSRNSYATNSASCIVMGFQSGRYARQSHVFQAKTAEEASEIVQVLQKAFKANKGVTKYRKGSESSSAPNPKSDLPLINSRLNAMEDEDELIEHKPINSVARRDNKRTTHAMSRTSSEGLPSSLPSPLTEFPQQLGGQSKKKLQRKSTSQRMKDKDIEFTQEQRKQELLKAVDKIVENNDLLREKCRVLLTPSSGFEEALVTLKTGNCDLLSEYLSSGRVSADSADGNGNSLLHYAVAMGNVDIIRVICNSANIEAAGWNDCRPLHRAVVEGNISVVQVLLQSRAQVNGLDIMKRTPLHISSAKLELNECSIALVEQGAQIMAMDLLGLRPYDLNSELKEIQNRLVTSACESFVAAKLKELTPNPSAGSSATPHSLSPASTRPSSTASGKLDRDLDDFVNHINLRAQVISHAHRSKLLSQPISRSFDDISELLKSTDNGATDSKSRLQQGSKFSSDYGLQSVYPEMEIHAHQVATKINTLVDKSKKQHGRRGQPGVFFTMGTGQGEETEDQWDELEMDISLSEPNLAAKENGDSVSANGTCTKAVSPMRRPFSSAAVLQSQQIPHPLSKVKNTSRVSPASTGTLIEDSVESEKVGGIALQQVSRVFDFNEGEGESTTKDNEEVVNLPSKALPRPLSSSHIEGSPGRITRRETNSIFDELILKMNEVSDQLDHPLSPSSDRRSSSEEVPAPSSPEKVVSPNTTDSKNTTEKTNNCPASMASEQTDKFSSLPRPKSGKKSASRTVSLSSSTLPKKSRGGKWLQRVGSPLLRSRKSFTGSPNSKRRRHRDEEVAGIKEESINEQEAGDGGGGESSPGRAKGTRRIFTRKRSLPDVHNYSTVSSPATTPTFPRTSSSDNFGISEGESSMTSFENQSNQLPKQSPLLSPPILRAPPSRSASRQGDPVTKSLELMVTLSSNKECLSTLVSYICMPKCESRLRQLSQDSQTSEEVLKNIATLMTNIFEAGDTMESKKNTLQSGVLDLTIKLLQGRDPVPGTCLSLLNSLLVSEDDSVFLRTIIRIPSKPLLHYLEPAADVVSESDSGYGNLRRDALITCTARSSSDASNHVTQDEGVAGVAPTTLDVPHSALRASSISEVSESSCSGRSLASPTLQGSSVTNLEARRIVLKMLAVSSTHSKMQNELSNVKALSLLSQACSDPSHENLTNALITLANVAQNVSSHELFLKLGLVEVFCNSLAHGPRPRYHASRALVYLGKLEILKEISLFAPMATGYETDVMIQTTDSDGHVYARGATIEKCVEMLTYKQSLLWGGFSLAIGPLSSAAEKINKASNEQIINFFLTLYKSFIHPLVFVRLLRHRLAVPGSESVFDWSVDMSSNSPDIKATPMPVIPPEQLNVFKLIGCWMESYPEDFVKYPLLQTEVEHVISRLRCVRGVYLPHTHRLKSLLQDVNRPQSESAVTDIVEEKREPHHENLYKLCKQMVTGGYLPVTSDEAVYLGSLQMHIEELSVTRTLDGSGSGSLTKGGRKATSRIKSAFPPGYTKSKHLLKRIQHQIKEFDKLSDRNSKHLYIERCQGNPGYDCTFFSVRVPSGGRFKKSGVSKQLLGISSKKVVFLHEKTKEMLLTHPLTSVLNVTREPDSPTLVFSFRGDMTEFKVQVESPSHALDMVNVLEQCKGDRMNTGESMAVRWSESQSSLLAYSVEDRLTRPDSPSDESSNEKTDERGATPPGPVLSNDLLKSSVDDDYSHLEPLASNGILDSTPSRRADTLGKESTDDISLAEEKPIFCDCPPDPELPLTFNLHSIILAEMLASPLEVARQMTLISHERFCAVTSIDLLEKVNLVPKRSSKVIQRESRVSNHSGHSLSLSLSDVEQQETNIEKLAYRFNQVGNWVASCILQFDTTEERSETIEQFISIAEHCYELRNYSSMMAIVVAGLGSAPIRRLHQSWAGVQKERKDLFKEMDVLLDSKGNYKKYRESLGVAATPCVPYIGVFLKDLTFICDGNPDYLRGGLINLHKRRQVYKMLQEVHHFQQDHYKLHKVTELSQYLLSHRLVPEDDLHSHSQSLEPRIKRSQSQTNARISSTSSQKGAFFKSISRSSLSSSNLNKV